jgi:hypothetical protein
MKRIKRLEEFESLNEGILSSIFGGIGNLFTSRKTKVESLLKKKYNNLADLNIEILTWIISLLDCTTKLVRSSELILGEDLSKNDNNILICEKLKASIYLSGKGAIKYNNQELYSNKGIVLKYQEFHHPIYHQNNKQFIENLCFLDALFFIGIDNLKRQLKKLE